MTDDGMNLRDLIHTTRAGRSFERLAEDAGGVPSRQRWQQLATQQQKQALEAQTVSGMARALHVTEAIVWECSGREIGIDVIRPQSPLISLIPPGTEVLTREQVNAVLTLVNTFLDAAPKSRRR
jgi:hypothetical protein